LGQPSDDIVDVEFLKIFAYNSSLAGMRGIDFAVTASPDLSFLFSRREKIASKEGARNRARRVNHPPVATIRTRCGRFARIVASRGK